MAASMFTFVVFVSSAYVVARRARLRAAHVIAFPVLPRPVTKGSLTLFVFTFTLCWPFSVRLQTRPC